MNRAIPIATVLATIALLITDVTSIHAADCPQPPDIITASVDVKPGSFPNPVNLKSEGVIPVALLGSDTFDVSAVDPSTVRFHPMGRCEQAAAPARYALTDVNGDGYTDLILHFRTQEVGFQPEDTAACLHGYLSNGKHFCGHDTVIIIGY